NLCVLCGLTIVLFTAEVAGFSLRSLRKIFALFAVLLFVFLTAEVAKDAQRTQSFLYVLCVKP
ncbi:MAG: hypothetical protein LC120_06780, partial [Bacteroidales bacterium]|nr:hypothetical protein [Bacteroidales bacterium]